MLSRLFNSFMVQRLLISGLTYFFTLLLAEKMGAALYGKLAFLVFYIKSLSSMNLGISYGFIFFSFKVIKKDFVHSYVFGYFIISLISLIIGSILIDINIFFTGLCLLPIFILDPILKLKRFFLCSLFPELFLVTSFAVSYLFFKETSIMYILSVMMMLLVFVGIVIYFNRDTLIETTLDKSLIKGFNLKTTLKQSKSLIKKGYSSYLYQLGLFIFLFTDRYLLKTNFPAESLGSCMLAYQFCQASLYIMSSWNFSSVIDIGNLIKEKTLTSSFVVKKLFMAAVIGAIPLIVLYFGLLVVEDSYFKDYQNLSLIFSVFAIGLYFSNLANSISPILFFFEKQMVSALSIIACIFVVIISYSIVVMRDGSYIRIFEYNYFALALSSIFTICYALYVLYNVTSKEEVIL